MCTSAAFNILALQTAEAPGGSRINHLCLEGQHCLACCLCCCCCWCNQITHIRQRETHLGAVQGGACKGCKGASEANMGGG